MEGEAAVGFKGREVEVVAMKSGGVEEGDLHGAKVVAKMTLAS